MFKNSLKTLRQLKQCEHLNFSCNARKRVSLTLNLKSYTSDKMLIDNVFHLQPFIKSLAFIRFQKRPCNNIADYLNLSLIKTNGINPSQTSISHYTNNHKFEISFIMTLMLSVLESNTQTHIHHVQPRVIIRISIETPASCCNNIDNSAVVTLPE